MGGLSAMHWLVVAGVAAVLLVGVNRVPKMMGEFGKGLRIFKKEMREMEAEAQEIKTLAKDPFKNQDDHHA